MSVSEIERDRYARSAKITLGERVVESPHFFTRLSNPDELRSFQELVMEGYPRIQGCVVRLFDAKNVLGPSIMDLTQTRVDAISKYVGSRFQEFLSKTIVVVDPATEYLFYEHHLSKWANDKATPRLIVDYARSRLGKKERLDQGEYDNWKEANHTLFWNKLSQDAAARNTLIGDVFDLELHYRSSILLPPVPVIRSKRDLEIAIQFNEIALAISSGKSVECAAYFIMQRGILDDEAIIDALFRYLSGASHRMVVLKFKYLDLAKSGSIHQLTAYRNFLQQVSFLKETFPDRVYMVLENGYQVFPSATVAFDFVSTHMTGFDKDSEFGHGEHGSWFDPEQMVHIPFKDMKEVYRNNQNRLPCAHASCADIDVDTIDADSWNILRRKHYVLTMSDYMTIIAGAIRTKRVELAIDKLINSDISRLKKLIPRT